MKGHDEQTQRTKASTWQKNLEKIGFTVINPYVLGDRLKESYLQIAGREPTYDEYLQEDIANLYECTDIFLCSDWKKSNGCRAEVKKSDELQLTRWYEAKMSLYTE